MCTFIWIFTSRLLYSSIIPRAPLKKKKKILNCLTIMSVNFKLWAMTLASCLVSLISSYDTGVLAVADTDISDSLALSKGKASWISKVSAIFCIVGAVLSCYVNSRFGRRVIIFVGDTLVICGSVAFCLARQYEGILFSRVLFGLGLGLTSTASFLFLTEWCLPQKRGQLMSVCGFFATTGIFLAFVIRQIFQNQVFAYK